MSYYVSASNMTMDFSPFQDSVFSSSYKVGFSAQYTVNGYVQTTQLNPTNDIVSAWQIIGNATSLGNVQNGTLQSNDRNTQIEEVRAIGASGNSQEEENTFKAGFSFLKDASGILCIYAI